MCLVVIVLLLYVITDVALVWFYSQPDGSLMPFFTADQRTLEDKFNALHADDTTSINLPLYEVRAGAYAIAHVDLTAMTSQVVFPDDRRGPLRDVFRLPDTTGQLQRLVTPNPWL